MRKKIFEIFAHTSFESEELQLLEQQVTQTANDLRVLKGNGELILVVDDQVDVRNLVQILLEHFNYKILAASDGIEVLSVYSQHKNEISLVLIDIKMPLLDGLTATRVLQQINPTVKVVVISGQVSSNKLLEASGLIVQAFLPKPYTIQELLNTIFDVLNAQ